MKRSMRAVLTGAAGIGLLWTATAGAGAACPQPRQTATAPADVAAQRNPLPPTWRTRRAGKALYHADNGNTPSCATCHGRRGDGDGVLAGQFTPPPRNFTCTAQLAPLSDGQLFWVIREGSPGTSMPAHPALSAEQAWQLVTYIRGFAE